MYTCKNCGKRFTEKYSRSSNGNFCSKHCARGFSTKYNRASINAKVSMTLKNKQIKRAKTYVTKCTMCGKEFEYIGARNKRKCCSLECQSLAHSEAGKKSKYTEQPNLKRTESTKMTVKKAVQKRRQKLKLMALEYKGGKCEKCGYDKCVAALEFHHLDPTKKKFGIGGTRTRAWATIKKELDKCILLCANCHREWHANDKSN